MLVAVKIADALEAKKFSQKAFAEIMGKSESEISEWLSGNRNFTIDTLSDISECLGIRLLPNSDIRTRRVSAHAVHVKVKKTRSPRQYSMSGNNVFRCGCGEWSISDNFVLA
jgi:transcriptional regulator with XRE-family HTH domain